MIFNGRKPTQTAKKDVPFDTVLVSNALVITKGSKDFGKS